MNPTTTVYMVPGLGIGPELFDGFPESASFQFKPIPWLIPCPDETLGSYAARLCVQVDAAKPFLLAGVSFGGVVAIEMAHILGTSDVLIISSLKDKQEGPFYFYWLNCSAGKWLLKRMLKLQKLVPGPVVSFSFGVRKNSGGSMICRALKDTNPAFLEWALLRLLEWNGSTFRGTITHVHGARDRLLPIRYMRPDVVIPDAGHLLIYTHAAYVRDACEEILSNASRDK